MKKWRGNSFAKRQEVQVEALNRGLIAVHTKEGIFLAWRLLRWEVTGYSKTGLTGTSFAVLKNGVPICVVTDSTNFLDREGTGQDRYAVAPVLPAVSKIPAEQGKFPPYGAPCGEVCAFASGTNYTHFRCKSRKVGLLRQERAIPILLTI